MVIPAKPLLIQEQFAVQMYFPCMIVKTAWKDQLMARNSHSNINTRVSQNNLHRGDVELLSMTTLGL